MQLLATQSVDTISSPCYKGRIIKLCCEYTETPTKPVFRSTPWYAFNGGGENRTRVLSCFINNVYMFIWQSKSGKGWTRTSIRFRLRNVTAIVTYSVDTASLSSLSRRRFLLFNMEKRFGIKLHRIIISGSWLLIQVSQCGLPVALIC